MSTSTKQRSFSSELKAYYMKQTKKKKSYFVSTGSDLLDMVVGGGVGKGFPLGKIVNIVGDKSSGKSFLSCEIVAMARKQYGNSLVWCYDDAESGLTHNTTDLYGFDIRSSEKRSATVEEWFCNILEFAKKIKPNQKGIYVLDSLDGLSSAEIEKRAKKRMSEFEKGETFKDGSFQMGKAKFLSQEFFKKVAKVIEDTNILLIIVSQTRDKIDSLFKEQMRTGGKALDFYAHTVLWLSNLQKIKKVVDKTPRSIGVIIKAKTTKSKTPRPYRICVFPILFSYGVDNIGANIDYLFDLRTERGELSKSAQSNIKWGSTKETSAKAIKEFLVAKKQMDAYKEKHPTFKKSDAIEYIESNEALKNAYVKEFGATMSRSELIELVESDEAQEKQLSKLVHERWENAEKAAIPKRRKKY